MFKHLYQILQIIVLFLCLSSCVGDDSFFQEENSTTTIVSSTATVTILNNFNDTINIISENNQCFRFSYPITMGYNTGSEIVIENYEALVNVISSQTTNFNITGIEFPVTIFFNTDNTPIIAEDENSLINIVRDCGNNTIRDDIDIFLNNCFTFDYPITLLDVNQNEVNINSNDELTAFYDDQGSSYQPDFVFPINLITISTQENNIIENYFEFYSIIALCDPLCPELDFTFEILNNSLLEYQFEASFLNLEDTESYSWFLNGEFIELDGPGNNGDNLLTITFDQPGLKEICIQAETVSCPTGVLFCQEILIETECLNLSFSRDGNVLFADFEGIDTIEFYQWSIDGDFAEAEGTNNNGDNQFSLENLAPGTYNICITYETPECPNPFDNEFCQQIIIE